MASNGVEEKGMYESLYHLAMMVGTILPAMFGLNLVMVFYKKRRDRDKGTASQGILITAADFLLLGNQVPMEESSEVKAQGESNKYLSLLFCTVGLQGAYLLWGVLQEKIMTTEYDGERFTSSNLLVLVNRLVAIFFALLVIMISPQPPHRAPALQYSFASATNVLSAFCQYEALIYVSFPMQTVAKACKVIPTMIMGTLVQGKRFTIHDYIGATLISIGVAAFSQLKSGKTFNIPSADDLSTVSSSQVVGVSLLVGYLSFDSFTSNWQGKLFADYKVSSFQAMLGISTFSSFISFGSLLQNGDLWPNVQFLQQHPSCLKDVMIMALCSAIGQLFIFHTISKHGPVVFTIISVTRQLLSIVLSGMLYGHEIPISAWGAVFITFFGIFYRTLAKSLFVKKKKQA